MLILHNPAGTSETLAAVVGNPVYDMASEHGLAVAAVAMLPVAAWLARAHRRSPYVAAGGGLRRAPAAPPVRVLAAGRRLRHPPRPRRRARRPRPAAPLPGRRAAARPRRRAVSPSAGPGGCWPGSCCSARSLPTGSRCSAGRHPTRSASRPSSWRSRRSPSSCGRPTPAVGSGAGPRAGRRSAWWSLRR